MTSSNFQGDETTMRDPVVDGVDRSDLEWKLHEGALGYGTVEESTDEPWGVSSHLHNDHGLGTERAGSELENSNVAWSLDDFVLAAICCTHDVVLAAASAAAAEVSVARKIERSGVDSWRRENTFGQATRRCETQALWWMA